MGAGNSEPEDTKASRRDIVHTLQKALPVLGTGNLVGRDERNQPAHEPLIQFNGNAGPIESQSLDHWNKLSGDEVLFLEHEGCRCQDIAHQAVVEPTELRRDPPPAPRTQQPFDRHGHLLSVRFRARCPECSVPERAAAGWSRRCRPVTHFYFPAGSAASSPGGPPATAEPGRYSGGRGSNPGSPLRRCARRLRLGVPALSQRGAETGRFYALRSEATAWRASFIAARSGGWGGSTRCETSAFALRGCGRI